MRSLGLPALILVAACSPERNAAPEPGPTPTFAAAPRTLVAADFDPDALGPRVATATNSEEPLVIEVGGHEVATITSYVACPETLAECVPGLLPEGTVLTCVHTLTLADSGLAEGKAEGAEAAAPAETFAALFRMTKPAPGFRGAVGYDLKQAEVAFGSRDAITITLDNGGLIWRVADAKGWKPGAPVTLWWQTTAPPAGLQQAYEIAFQGETRAVRAPFPAADKAVERAAVR
jgi:hypothetical protein